MLMQVALGYILCGIYSEMLEKLANDIFPADMYVCARERENVARFVEKIEIWGGQIVEVTH